MRIKSGFAVNKSKKLAALKLIRELKILNKNNLQKIVIGIESLISAYCSISNASTKETKKKINVDMDKK